MSLDVWLRHRNDSDLVAADLLHEHGFYDQEKLLRERQGDTCYEANITHNLGRMAQEAGIYKHLWRPEELNITKAGQLVEPLTEGLRLLQSDAQRFRAFSPENGWGTYEGLVKFVGNYLAACKENPQSEIQVSR